MQKIPAFDCQLLQFFLKVENKYWILNNECQFLVHLDLSKGQAQPKPQSQ